MKIRPFLRLLTDYIPSVDVMIVCCGEPVNIALDTVKAACALDYLTSRHRVILLDDSQSTALRDEVIKVQTYFPNLFYSARGTRVTTHSKAANINHGMEYASSLKGGPFTFCAVLDVDMIPQPHWLRSTIPHLLKDTKVAMASIPQYFYNMCDGDPLDQTVDDICDITLVQQDMLGDAICTGSGWVARRDAIHDIGGIPTQYTQEDIVTSALLQAKGWKVVYVWEPLQHGLVPTTFADNIK